MIYIRFDNKAQKLTLNVLFYGPCANCDLDCSYPYHRMLWHTDVILDARAGSPSVTLGCFHKSPNYMICYNC